MLEALNFLGGLLKVKTISIDNDVFRLHYKLTVVILLASWMLISSNQLFRDPMDCYFPDYPNAFLNTYCYIHSTFLVEKSQKNPNFQRFPHPGVSGYTEKDTLKFYGYYQWVFVVLFLQAISFYLPHYLWKKWEGGLIRMLSVDLSAPFVPTDSIKKNTDMLLEYFQQQMHSHNTYAWKYFWCELLNLMNVVGQIFFMNTFLGDQFSYQGLRVIFNNWQEGLQAVMDLMQRVFPTVTKCTFKKYGPSGSMEGRDGMCILTQNALNQKIYVFLWFWFHILAVISATVVVIRLFTIAFSSVRLRHFRFICKLNSTKDVNVLFDKLRIGDWFLLCMLQRNINSVAYKELILSMARSCDSNASSIHVKGFIMPCAKYTLV